MYSTCVCVYVCAYAGSPSWLPHDPKRSPCSPEETLSRCLAHVYECLIYAPNKVLRFSFFPGGGGHYRLWVLRRCVLSEVLLEDSSLFSSLWWKFQVLGARLVLPSTSDYI